MIHQTILEFYACCDGVFFLKTLPGKMCFPCFTLPDGRYEWWPAFQKPMDTWLDFWETWWTPEWKDQYLTALLSVRHDPQTIWTCDIESIWILSESDISDILIYFAGFWATSCLASLLMLWQQSACWFRHVAPSLGRHVGFWPWLFVTGFRIHPPALSKLARN